MPEPLPSRPAGLLQDGWLAPARRLPSPFCDARPSGAVPELLVVHGISLPPGEFGGPWIDQLFLGRLDAAAHPYFADIAQLRVSAHLLIRRDGAMIQYVPFPQRAWHAGASMFDGRAHCNDFSIGIELEGADDVPYTGPQYARLAQTIHALRQAYPTLAALAGHEDIAPGRKTDPGPAFDWARLAMQMQKAGLAVHAHCANGARLAIMPA